MKVLHFTSIVMFCGVPLYGIYPSLVTAFLIGIIAHRVVLAVNTPRGVTVLEAYMQNIDIISSAVWNDRMRRAAAELVEMNSTVKGNQK